jgi:arylsulfatase A-like enzyme
MPPKRSMVLMKTPQRITARTCCEPGVWWSAVFDLYKYYRGNSGDIRDWDAHDSLEENYAAMAKMVDKPVAGLLADLKSNGLLDSTLVVWTSEFGRTSYGQSGNGRDHNPWGYTQWLAGGGVKAGTTYGETEAIGLKAAKGKEVDTYDLHATVLNQLGLDHLKVTFQNQGHSERPTVVYGKVIKELIA